MLALPRDRNTMLGILRRVDAEFKRVARASVNDNIEKLGVQAKRISADERMRRVAMLHGENIDGTPI